MRPVTLVACALFTVAFPRAIEAQDTPDQPATPEKQVQPVYPADRKSFLLERVKVEVVIDERGVPFSLKAAAGMPDNVVHALSEWRFHPARRNGTAVPSAITLSIPVHRPMDRAGGLTRSWRSTKEISDVFTAAKELNPDSAARLEAANRDSFNLTSHLTLLAYTRSLNGPDANAMRLRRILWLAQRYPASEVLGAPFAVPAPPSASDAESYEQLRRIWLDQLAANPKDPTILNHATNFLRFSNPEIVEQASLSAMNETDDASVYLGDLYALSALGVTAVDPVTGRAAEAGEQMPVTPFAEKSKALLAGADDLRILFSALNTVSTAGRSLAAAGHVPAGYEAFCEQLLARAKTYYAEVASTCNDTAPPAAALAKQRAGGTVQSAKLIRQDRPVYPPEAKAQHITGTVAFEALVGKDGKIRRLEMLSGPLALYESARDAVLRWEYKPTMLNGDPVDVITTIDVNYTLN